MIVGTVTTKVTRWSVISRRNWCGSNRLIKTRRWRISKAIVAVVKPVLWLSGTGTKVVSPSCAPSGSPMAAGIRLSPPDSMSLGRPVLPPDPIAFHTGETASGNAASDNAGSGVKPAGTLGISGWSRPTSRAGGRRSSRPCNSVAGNRADSGWGTAPSFQHATAAWIHSTELGSTMVT
jgi:hypothetical protein